MRPIITFISDFGTSDWFVAAVKGQILTINPEATIIDVAHSIVPHDVRSAAFILRACYQDFPVGTVHLVVVDPGVGGTRKPIIVASDDYYFVGPDNGVFSYVFREDSNVFAITVARQVSATFHARDIFAPAAASLSKGEQPHTLGHEIHDYMCFPFPQVKNKGNEVHGEIVYIDQFGNLITNIPISVDAKALRTANKMIRVKQCYADGEEGELIAIRGSTGFFEIAVKNSSAQKLLQVCTGTAVVATTA